MKLSHELYKYVYNKLNYAQKVKPVLQQVEKAIDPSDIKIVLRDSRTMKPTACRMDKFQDFSEIMAKIPERVRREVAKYPKGTFKRTNTVYVEPITNKKHVITYEGITVDFDFTTEGYQLPKIRNYYMK
jgi:hypothetical protein